jgi:hypothetical protein
MATTYFSYQSSLGTEFPIHTFDFAFVASIYHHR